MNRIILKTSIVVAAALSSLPAQSNLSLTYPAGLPLQPQSTMAVAMGGAATGVYDDNHVALSNPANLGAISRTAFSSNLSVDILRSNNGKKHANSLAIAPRQLSFAIPLNLAGTLGFAVTKQSDAAMAYRSPVQMIADSGSLGQPRLGRLTYDRNGGMTGWYVGWGRMLGKYLSLGIGYERLYLTINSTGITELINEPSITTRDSSYFSFRGNSIRGGVMASYRTATIGISGTYVLKGDAQNSSGIYRPESATPIENTASQTNFSLQLPPSIAAGISWRPTAQWIVAADGSATLWNRFVAPSSIVHPSTTIAPTLSLGTRFIPSPDALAPKYYETVHYRAGVSWSRLPAATASEYSLMVGPGFPLKANGLLDIVFKVGRRIDTALPDYSETFLSIGIGINGGKKWVQSSNENY